MLNKNTNKETAKTYLMENYVATSGAPLLAFCKPMQHKEYFELFPVTIEVLDALSVAEWNPRADEWRLRFRPSNGDFVRACKNYGIHGNYSLLCSSDELKAIKDDEQRKMLDKDSSISPNTLGLGHAFECALSHAWGNEWSYDESPYWTRGDIVSPDGLQVQCKRYGGSIHGKSVEVAVNLSK